MLQYTIPCVGDVFLGKILWEFKGASQTAVVPTVGVSLMGPIMACRECGIVMVASSQQHRP